jgi:hypothetical protein
MVTSTLTTLYVSPKVRYSFGVQCEQFLPKIRQAIRTESFGPIVQRQLQ